MSFERKRIHFAAKKPKLRRKIHPDLFYTKKGIKFGTTYQFIYLTIIPRSGGD